MVRGIAFALLITLLAACAPTPSSPNSPYYTLPRHSRMVLEQPITLPAPGIDVWLQSGKVLAGNPNRYEPACQLLMKKRADREVTIQPDSFEVTSVERSMWEVAADSPIRPVALRVGSGDQGGGPMAWEMRTLIYLKSERQPGVYRLTCQYWDRPWYPRHLTVNQISDTLRGLFRIEPPA